MKVFPDFSQNEKPDVRRAYAELPSEGGVKSVFFRRCVPSAKNLASLGFAKFRGVHLGPPGVPTFLHGVVMIFLRRAKEQMVRVAAERRVARVTNNHAFRNLFPVGKRDRQAMHPPSFFIDVNPPVAVRKLTACPDHTVATAFSFKKQLAKFHSNPHIEVVECHSLLSLPWIGGVFKLRKAYQ